MIATCLTLVCAMMMGQAGGQTPPPAGGQSAPVAAVAAAKVAVTFLHVSPDAPAVDVYVNGKKEIEKLAFGKPSKKELAAGEAKIELKEGEKVVLTVPPQKLAGDKGYTILVTGKAAELKANVLEAKGALGKAHVVVFHASPDAGPLDVMVGEKESKGLAMGKSFETDLAAGKCQISVGELDKSLDLKADVCYCVVAAGLAKGDPKAPKLELIVVEHSTAPAAPKDAGKK